AQCSTAQRIAGITTNLTACHTTNDRTGVGITLGGRHLLASAKRSGHGYRSLCFGYDIFHSCSDWNKNVLNKIKSVYAC
ncbi:hypothetical protein PL75_11465, partial [Neisseria arctica]